MSRKVRDAHLALAVCPPALRQAGKVKRFRAWLWWPWTAIAYGLLFPVADATVGVWSFGDHVSRAVVVTIAGTVAASAAWTIFHSARHARWYFAAGLVGGLLLLFAR